MYQEIPLQQQHQQHHRFGSQLLVPKDLEQKMWRRVITKHIRRLARRPMFCVISLLDALLLAYIIFGDHAVEYEFYQQNYLQYISQLNSASSSSSSSLFSQTNNTFEIRRKQICELPIDISPFDSSILPYLRKLPPKVTCPESSHLGPLTFVEALGPDRGRLRQIANSTYECRYQTLRKALNDDDTILRGPETRLDPVHGLILEDVEHYLSVECDDYTDDSVKSYQNLHFWFNPSKVKNISAAAANGLEKPSVLILVIESLSRLNYLRYLNRTRDVLENRYRNVHYLEGMNKMADNSYLNMVPFLTGKRLFAGELPKSQESSGPFDDWPFVWRQFRDAGYVTALLEDYAQFTLFNHGARGFVRDKPTDLYPRPFWLRLFDEYSPILRRLTPFALDDCYQRKTPKIDIFLEQIRQMFDRAASARLPLFAYTFYVEMTHNDFNRAQTLDQHLSQFFARSTGQLNDTLVLLMGDHGNRFGSVLQTTIGRVEERMPLFAVRIPHSLDRRFPHLSRNLRRNRRRLATWFDAYRMLRDIAEHNFDPIPGIEKEVRLKSTYSPWREEIPARRDCARALIPELHCACDRRLALKINDTITQIAARKLLTYLNSRLSSGELCHRLRLRRIAKSELIFPSSSTVHARGFRQIAELTIETTPGGAIFRSTLFRTAKSEWTVDGGLVTRLNEYGTQSECVSARDLKTICYCRRQIVSSSSSSSPDSSSTLSDHPKINTTSKYQISNRK